MPQARWTLFLVSIPALSPAALATVSDRYTLKIGSLQSQTQFEIGSSLGPCLLGTRERAHISGELDLQLRPGAQPASNGQIEGGRCAPAREILGIVPNGMPGTPPLLVVHLGSFAFAPLSRPFACDANGSFLTQTTCEVNDGTLDVSVLGGDFVSVPIHGVRSDSTRSRGRAWIDENGVHVLYEIDSRFHLRVPDSDVSLQIAVRSVIRGDAEIPIPTQFRPAGSAPRGPTRFSPSEQQLLVPPGLASPSHPSILDDLQQQLANGNGRASSRWGFQIAYREALARAVPFDGLDRIRAGSVS